MRACTYKGEQGINKLVLTCVRTKMDGHLTYVACSTIQISVKTPGLISNRNLQNDYNSEINFRECKIGHISLGFVFAERKI